MDIRASIGTSVVYSMSYANTETNASFSVFSEAKQSVHTLAFHTF
jgi:hypothetical protein